MNRSSVLAAATLAAALTLAGCGSSDHGHDMGSMGSPSSATAPAGPTGASPAAGPHDDADVTFAQMTVPHHRQAVEMADMLLAKQGIDADVTALATRIRAAQVPEIDQMTGWLTRWGQDASPMSMDHDMGGLMSQDAMDALDRASGDEAARLFLSGMVKHHQGAIDMADDELAGGQNADAKKLARSIKDSQQAEIATMTTLLKRY